MELIILNNDNGLRQVIHWNGYRNRYNLKQVFILCRYWRFYGHVNALTAGVKESSITWMGLSNLKIHTSNPGYIGSSWVIIMIPHDYDNCERTYWGCYIGYEHATMPRFISAYFADQQSNNNIL